MTITTNPQLEKAFEYIQNTNQHIFLTGKAGTGKTTFLHRVKKECTKRMAIVAPTGVAAINAKGMTIHSLFQLPFGPYLPNAPEQRTYQRKFSKAKINLLKSLDLLVIDEISMVRADVLDGIDAILRKYKNRHLPFGGLQLLMIGDLHQLPPVANQKEWKLLQEYYPSPYFFDSQALQKNPPITIQLTHIYRQSDEKFIALLNKVRTNQLDEATYQELNSRYLVNFQPTKEEGYITLTALNRTAQAINEEQLIALKGSKRQFKAKIEGEFPAKSFPTEEILEFKIGAQVLFIRNDSAPEKRFYNGKIGQIVEFSDDTIWVKCPDSNDSIAVKPLEWTNKEYRLEGKSNEVVADIKGTFTQYPLKLAWAITIHKSQGLTFEKAIIDAEAAFAHGQVYVALSRCKSFAGVVLRSPIGFGCVKTDTKVRSFSETAAKCPPTEEQLFMAKQQYQQALLLDLFDFKSVRFALAEVVKVFKMHQPKLTASAYQQIIDWEQKVKGILFQTAAKFEPILKDYFSDTELPEAQPNLLNRLQKAGQYFTKKIKRELLDDLRAVPIVTDNKEVWKIANTAMKNLEKCLFLKHRCFLELQKNNFTPSTFLRAKGNAEIDFETLYKSRQQNNSIPIPREVPHPELYRILYNWRNAKAVNLKRSVSEVISTRSIIDMTKILPVDKKAMEKVRGFGLVKWKTFGKEIIQLIDDYCYENKLSPNCELATHSPKAYSVEKTKADHPNAYSPWSKEEETELRQLSQSGKSIAYIAGVLGRNKGAISSRLEKLKIANSTPIICT